MAIYACHVLGIRLNDLNFLYRSIVCRTTGADIVVTIPVLTSEVTYADADPISAQVTVEIRPGCHETIMAALERSRHVDHSMSRTAS